MLIGIRSVVISGRGRVDMEIGWKAAQGNFGDDENVLC